MKGKLITIEGIDGSGKSTQTKLLISYLKKSGQFVKTIHFPQHDHDFFGVLIDKYLNNDFGMATKVDYRLASVLYAGDRFEAKRKIMRWLENGLTVVLDRYTESNFGHQAGKIQDKKQRGRIMQWLYDLDYKVFKNPRPDRVFFLDVPETVAFELQIKMNKKKDGHESNLEYLKNTRKAYIEACEKFKYWRRIECMGKDGLLTKKEIADKIIKKIKKI